LRVVKFSDKLYQLFCGIFILVFVEDKQPWWSTYKAFFRLFQMLKCSKLIVVPLSVFHRMAESVGDPKGELIFLFNTGRCGSTLLSEVIDKAAK